MWRVSVSVSFDFLTMWSNSSPSLALGLKEQIRRHTVHTDDIIVAHSQFKHEVDVIFLIKHFTDGNYARLRRRRQWFSKEQSAVAIEIFELMHTWRIDIRTPISCSRLVITFGFEENFALSTILTASSWPVALCTASLTSAKLPLRA